MNSKVDNEQFDKRDDQYNDSTCLEYTVIDNVHGCEILACIQRLVLTQNHVVTMNLDHESPFPSTLS